MVLRKPYAFIIKHFKLIHIIMFVLTGILILNTFTTLNFLNEFLNSNLAYITKADFTYNYSITLIIIPFIILAVFLGLLAIMSMKKKPIKFYIFSSIGLAIIIALNIYTRGIMYSMIESMQTIQTIKIMADMLLFSVFFECFILLTCFIRGIGFNISRFDFNTDLNEMIEENDNEEVELQFDLDLNDVKRNSNKRKRQIKYFIKENQFILKIVGGVLGVLVLFLGLKLYLSTRKDITRSSVTFNDFTFEVIESYMLNTDINNNKFENDTYLIAVKANITNENPNENKIFKTGTLLLDLDNDTFKVSEGYSNDIQDLGVNYLNTDIGPKETKEYVIVFAVPKKYINSKKYIGIRNIYEAKTKYVKLNPIKLYDKTDNVVESSLGKSISFEDSTLKNTKFTINSYDVQERFKIEYKFKYYKDNSVNSIEYITPKILDKKIDKALMKIDVNYENKGSKDIMYLFEKFGRIEFEKDGTKYSQTFGFNRVIPSAKGNENIYYIEVNRNMVDADKICIIFKIRNIEYKYVLK